MNNLLHEFKQFAMRGNVIDMAVGVIMGGAFGKIVSSLVSDIIMPPIGLLIGNVSFNDLRVTIKEASIDAAGKVVPGVTINIGAFMEIVIDFLLISFTIFLFIKALNSLHRKAKDTEVAAPAPMSKDQELLTEIRDLLKKGSE